jgi:hypothetical protein
MSRKRGGAMRIGELAPLFGRRISRPPTQVFSLFG